MSDFFNHLLVICSFVIGGLALWFLSPYIILGIKWILTKMPNLALVIILLAFLNLAGSLVAYTVFHLYSSIILSVAGFVTPFTAGIIGTGFTGLFFATIGILIYKLLK